MRRLLAVAFGLALVSGCLPFKEDGLYACDTDTGKDCVTCDAATGWCRDITAIKAGTSSLRTIYGISSNAIWAGGLNGVIVRWNGTRWTPEPRLTAEQINGLWASSEDDVFAVGSNYTWLHYNGGSWTAYEELAWLYWPFGQVVPDVDKTWASVNHFSAVGGRASGSAGVAWTGDDQGILSFLCNDITAGSCAGLNWPLTPWQSDNYWAIDGVVQVGMVAAPVGPTVNVAIMGIWSDSSPSNTYFVGEQGAIIKDTDAAIDWSGIYSIEVPSAGKPLLYGVWGDLATKNVFAVGAAGSVARFDETTTTGGAVWSNAGVAVDLFGICGVSENDVWAVGEAGTVVHWNGATWSQVPQSFQETLWGVACTASDVFVVTDEGAILRYKRPPP